MAITERPFHCADGTGALLRGVLTEPPPGVDRRVGLVLLSAGLLPRYGYHRHYVKGARALAAVGVTVLRIDLPGLGEATGELADGPVEARWREIQLGGFVPAALAAGAALRQQLGLERVVLGGACGGAITALLAAAQAPDQVAGCLAISLPICLSGTLGRGQGSAPRPAGAGVLAAGPQPPSPTPAADYERDLHPRHAQILMRQYVNKLLSPRAWGRLVSGRSELVELQRAVLGTLRRWRGGLLGRLGARRSTIPADGRLNPRFLPAIRRVVQQRLPLLVVFGELDPDADDFQRYFAAPVLSRDTALRQGMQLELFPAEDHTFAHPEAEQRLWRCAADWLTGRVMPTAGSVPSSSRGDRGPSGEDCRPQEGRTR